MAIQHSIHSFFFFYFSISHDCTKPLKITFASFQYHWIIFTTSATTPRREIDFLISIILTPSTCKSINVNYILPLCIFSYLKLMVSPFFDFFLLFLFMMLVVMALPNFISLVALSIFGLFALIIFSISVYSQIPWVNYLPSLPWSVFLQYRLHLKFPSQVKTAIINWFHHQAAEVYGAWIDARPLSLAEFFTMVNSMDVNVWGIAISWCAICFSVFLIS